MFYKIFYYFLYYYLNNSNQLIIKNIHNILEYINSNS